MKKTIPWLENDDFAPDMASEESADSPQESEEESSFWDNMIFPI